MYILFSAREAAPRIVAQSIIFRRFHLLCTDKIKVLEKHCVCRKMKTYINGMNLRNFSCAYNKK